MAPAEFVRETVLALARGLKSVATVPIGHSLALRIKQMFRYIWFLATDRCEKVLREGCQDDVNALVVKACALHDNLRGKRSDGVGLGTTVRAWKSSQMTIMVRITM